MQVRFINMSFAEIMQFKATMSRKTQVIQTNAAREAKAAAVMSAVSQRLIAQANNSRQVVANAV